MVVVRFTRQAVAQRAMTEADGTVFAPSLRCAVLSRGLRLGEEFPALHAPESVHYGRVTFR